MQESWKRLVEDLGTRSSVTDVTVVMTTEDVVNMVGASMFGNMVGDYSAIIATRYLINVNSNNIEWREIVTQITEKCTTEYIWFVK